MGRVWLQYGKDLPSPRQGLASHTSISTKLTLDYTWIAVEFHALHSVDLREMSLRSTLHLREILLG